MKCNLLNAWVILCVLVVSACTKYSEGGWSNRAKKNLTGNSFGSGKKWHVTKYVVNGIDSTQYINGKAPISYTVGTITFVEDAFENSMQMCTTKRFEYKTEFTDRKRSLQFKLNQEFFCSFNNCEYDVFKPSLNSNNTVEWKIRELTETRLSLLLVGDNIYQLTLSSGS